MKLAGRIAANKPLAMAWLLALICLAASIALLLSSLTGRPASLFGFIQGPEETLPEGRDIAGWASFDRDSYLMGEEIRYRARVLYRPDRVVPDLGQFLQSISFAPVEKRHSTTRIDDLGGGISEYRLEYVLQGVDVRPGAGYQPDPVVLFYRSADPAVRELQSLRIPTPGIYFNEYYPRDVAEVPLKPLKREVRDAYRLRQGVMLASGGILLTLALALLWRHGRRRRERELSRVELLWREFHAIDRGSLSAREYLLACEHIATRLLDARAGLSPAAFWRRRHAADAQWDVIAEELRRLLERIYARGALEEEAADRFTAVLEQTFAAVVAEDVLRREMEPTPWKRLARQPRVVAAAAGCATLALAMFVLGAFPGLWFSPELERYNEAVAGLSAGVPLLAEADVFEDLADTVENPLVQAAAWYNAGTVRARLKPADNPPLGEGEILEMVFREEAALDHYLEDEEAVEMFFASAGWLKQARQNLQDAARLEPGDGDILRNLELVSKRHEAVVAAIQAMFEGMKGQGDQNARTKLETMVDVLNPDWPEEVEEREEEEDRGRSTYKISEHF